MKILGECTTGMLGQLKRAEDSHMELIKMRSNLEHEIIIKRKTLYMDRERGQLLRSLFPPITDLSEL
jgi:tektin-4